MSRDVVALDEQWALVRNGNGHPAFLIVAGWGPDTWIQSGSSNGRPGFASFDVYEITGTDVRRREGADGEWVLAGHFGFTKQNTRGEMTTDLDEAVRIAYGSVKWDGCCDYMVSEQEDVGFACFLHVCDVDGLVLLSEALQTAYKLCAVIVDVDGNFPEPAPTPSRDPVLEQPGTTGDTAPVQDWVLQVYNPAIKSFVDYFTEAGVPFEVADHNARALLARLAYLQPPLTIEALR